MASNIPVTTVREVPLDPASTVWRDAPRSKVQVAAQKMTKPNGGRAFAVDVSVLVSKEHFAVRLRWPNESSEAAVGLRQFRDSCAVMFPAVPSQDLPPFIMGGEGKPVVIWQWKPDWENPGMQEEYRKEHYPQYGDAYNPHNERLWKERGDRPRNGEAANVVVAEGFGTVTRTTDPDLEVQSHRTEAGDWEVVFRHALPTTYPTLGPGIETALNIAVWDGAHDDVGCRKSLSYEWHPFTIPVDAVAVARAGAQLLNPPVVAATLSAAGIAWVIRRRMERAGKTAPEEPAT